MNHSGRGVSHQLQDSVGQGTSITVGLSERATPSSRPRRNGPQRVKAILDVHEESRHRTRKYVVEAVSSVLGTAASLAHEVLFIGVDLLQFAPVPALDVAGKILLSIWDAVDMIQINRLSCLRVTERCAGLLLAIREEMGPANEEVVEAFREPIARLDSAFARISEFLQEEARRPFWLRYVKREEIRRNISYFDTLISDAQSTFGIQIRIRLYILEHANGVRDRQDKRSRRDAHPIPGQPHIIDTLIVSQRLDNLPDPDQIPKALSVYRDAQNASDLAGDTADLRRLLHTSLQGIDDVSMMEVLQVSRDEMPKAIQALQHSLEPNTRRGRPSKASRSKPLPAVPTLADADDETRTLNQDFVRASIQVLRRLSQVADPSAPGRIPARLANGEDDLQEPFASPNAIQTEVPLTPIASTQDGRSDNNPLSATKRRKTGNLKSTKVSLQDPTWKVLPAALMKCKVVDDDWRNYAMLICYGPDRHAERCLSYDERPLHLFQKFKDARKDPVFMLRHIRDLPSPTVVAQQKKDASKVVDTSGAPFPQHRGTVDGKPTQSDSQGSLSNSNLILNEVTPKSAALPITPSSASRGSWYEQEGIRQYGGDEEGTSDEPRTEVSYGIAVCPFVTQEQDEFDVMFGDMFVIVSRKGNWSFVQRDLQGMGAADGDPSKKGWIPTGCLILTRVPIAQAVAPVFSDFSPGSALSLATRCAASAIYARAPILPLRIVSTSFLGHAIIKFKARDDGELDLSKNDPVRVLKRFHHWSYVVKEYSGERGWVPGWYISKVTDRQ